MRPERRATLERAALLLYLASVVTLTSVHDPLALAGAHKITLESTKIVLLQFEKNI